MTQLDSIPISYEQMRGLVVAVLAHKRSGQFAELWINLGSAAIHFGHIADPGTKHAVKGRLHDGFPYHDVMLGSSDRARAHSILWDLLIEGVIRPGLNDGSNAELPFYHVTEYGASRITHEGEKPTPYDPDGYLAKLKAAVPKLDPITCRRLGLDPFAYLRDAFARLPTLPAGRMNELLPDRWAADGRESTAGMRPRPGRARGRMAAMANVTQILAAIEQGDPKAAAELLPLVYSELRKLATARLAGEAPGQTLQPTALVHEAYLRLVGGAQPDGWNGRGHFFAAAAEAMRRILVDVARRKQSLKGGGGRRREDLDRAAPAVGGPDLDLLALDEALARLEQRDPRKAQLVKLRFFAGLTVEQAARALGIATSTADEDWAYARSWLRLAIAGSPADAPEEKKSDSAG